MMNKEKMSKTLPKKGESSTHMGQIGIRTIAGENAKVLIAFFEEDLKLLDKSDDCIKIKIDKENQQVKISSNKGPSYVENKIEQIIKMCSNVQNDVIKVEKNREDEIEKVLKHLESNAIYFTESQVNNARLFRIKTRTPSLMKKCMSELNQLLGQPFEKSLKGKVVGVTEFKLLERKSLDEEEKVKSSHRQNISQRDQRNFQTKQKQESSKNQAGSLPTEKATHVHKKPSHIKRKLDVRLKNGLRFMVYVHDIISASVEAIVNPANEDLANTGECAYIISTAAGTAFESDCEKIIKKKKKVKVTENEISGPGKLPFKCIINAVGPQWASYDDNHKIRCLEDLYITIRKVLETSEKEKFKSVAIPPVSSGIFGIPKELCAPMYVQAIVDFDFLKKTFPQEVHVVDLSDEVLDLTCKAYQSFTEDPKIIEPKAILKKYEIFTKKITMKQTKSSDKYPEQNPCRLFKHDGEKAIFEMGRGVKIFIYRDDLVMLRGIGTLVSAENSAFTGSGALAQSILQRAGPSYVKYHYQVQLDSRNRRISKRSTIVLDAGKLDYKFVIHAIVSRFSEDVDRKEDELLDLKITTLNVLRHADLLCTHEKKSKNLEKIAMPLLGAGEIRYPRILELLCSYVYQGIQEFFMYPSALKEVHLVSFNEETHRAFTKVFLDVSTKDFLDSKYYPPSNLPSLRDTDDNREAANASSAVWKTEESTLVNWNNIHHKTKPTEESEGKVDKSGREYLHCVEELKNIGITVSKTERKRTEKIMNTGML